MTPTLASALAAMAPGYSDVQHRKVAKAMEKDMQAKHTEGPWDVKVFRGREETSLFVEGRIADDRGLCCQVQLVGDRPNDEDMANARLIAASPCLLAALEALVKDATECEVDGEPSQVDGIQWDDVLAARAAIAKARGGVA